MKLKNNDNKYYRLRCYINSHTTAAAAAAAIGDSDNNDNDNNGNKKYS